MKTDWQLAHLFPVDAGDYDTANARQICRLRQVPRCINDKYLRLQHERYRETTYLLYECVYQIHSGVDGHVFTEVAS